MFVILFNSEKLASWNLYLLTWSISLFVVNLPLLLLSLSYSCCDPPCWANNHKEAIHPHIAWASAFTLGWTISSCNSYSDSACTHAVYTGLPFHQHPPCFISASTSYAGWTSPPLFCGYPLQTDRLSWLFNMPFSSTIWVLRRIYENWRLRVSIISKYQSWKGWFIGPLHAKCSRVLTLCQMIIILKTIPYYRKTKRFIHVSLV